MRLVRVMSIKPLLLVRCAISLVPRGEWPGDEASVLYTLHHPTSGNACLVTCSFRFGASPPECWYIVLTCDIT